MFLWVVQHPSEKDSTASYFGAAGYDDDDPLSFLPEGFTARTKDVGLCLPQWAPQGEIRKHRAVSGFLSHCRWNSTLEAVDAGMPMMAWPLFAEMLPETVGMALWSAAMREKGRMVPHDEVAAIAKKMVIGEKGEAARNMSKTMKKPADEALATRTVGPKNETSSL
ncbi:hypothetical protein PR202_ga10471 [Eleusine coracana subsp. coracana]|uniref:Uncharacterized protein n=1 Tax=Eleusine coracana subsp. coracana TaxID=191504 RepID=A0AAV5C6T5_ELECO|nr:hypothetical protein QOZ80_1AG0024930 [Eleusine coracana subsp. coracana]GJM93879.1 hypothetical protein PR202_ga10471 [Eleusine coracana subsp. coracana]